MSAVWLVRHAPVAVSGVCYGQIDVTTNMDASSAADSVEAALRELGARWDELWSSPWVRTRAVAEELAKRSGAPRRSDPRLSELSFGEWEGRRFDELEQADAVRWSRWMSEFDTVAPPGGETANELVVRVGAWLAEVTTSGKDVLAVVHGGTIRAARAARAQLPYSAVAQVPAPFLVPEKF